MDIIISTFPRSGSNFLREYLTQRTDIKTIIKTHSPIDKNLVYDEPVVSIARNPLDSIASIVSMEKTLFDGDIEGYIKTRIEDYLYFYSNIQNASMILSYDDLIADPDIVVTQLCSKLNGTMNNEKYESLLQDKYGPKYTNNYIVTSSSLSNYSLIHNKVASYDLSECNELYLKCLGQ